MKYLKCKIADFVGRFLVSPTTLLELISPRPKLQDTTSVKEKFSRNARHLHGSCSVYQFSTLCGDSIRGKKQPGVVLRGRKGFKMQFWCLLRCTTSKCTTACAFVVPVGVLSTKKYDRRCLKINFIEAIVLIAIKIHLSGSSPVGSWAAQKGRGLLAF